MRRVAVSLVALAALGSARNALAVGNIYQLTADGAWTWFNDPRALYSNGRVYSGWVKSNGTIEFGYHNLATQTTTTALLYNGAFFQSDDHDNPAFIQNSANSLTAYYAPHGGASVRRQDITINGDGSITPGPVTTLPNTGAPTGSSGWTYANPFHLSSESKTYVFSRGPNFNPVVRTQIDGSGTWTNATTFISNPGQRPYVKYDSNNADRIGVAFTDGHPRNVDNNIYYTYIKNGAYYAANGVKIKDMSAGALTPADMATSAGGAGVVWDRTASVPTEGSNSWIWDVATDPATGNPVIAYTTFPSNERHQYHWARWTGSEWDDRILINNAGGTIALSGEINYSGGLVLDHSNPEIVYTSARNAGTWNLQQWKLNDDDLTWATELIANGFGPHDENVRPYVPLNRPADTEMVMFLRGQYDYWNNTIGAGYDMSVQLWTNGSLPESEAFNPEPGSIAAFALAALALRRRRVS